jgi:glucose/arabinose dehydrogenase
MSRLPSGNAGTRLRRSAAALLLLAGIAGLAPLVVPALSNRSTPIVATLGAGYVVAGLVLLRTGSLGLWLGAIVPGIGAVLGVLGSLMNPGGPTIARATLSAIVFSICLYLLLRRRAPAGRRAWLWRSGRGVLVMALVFAGSCTSLIAIGLPDPHVTVYDENCSVCHGQNLEGMALGPSLVGRELTHGGTVSEIATSIANGFPQTGMPGWSEALGETQIQGLAIWIGEQRASYSMVDFNVDNPLVVPNESIESERHRFRLETVASGLHPLPFSIAPLPDGRILVVEKTQGLRIVSTDGTLSELIEGTPPAHADGITFPPQWLVNGIGWMLDVALHPDYEENGWIYLHFADRCSDCDTSMNKLVRGRIEDGRWIDQETIWEADPSAYTSGSDMGRGGRISFDDQGHVFLSVGMMGNSNHRGPQDLGLPFGKIHRVYDDGRVPADNPFVNVPGALPTTWTYGHRSPQGLEFDRRTGKLWGTEMGPRGGDEFNLLLPGRNYGWPLTSKGINYDGSPVDYGKQLGIEFDLEDIEQPVVDLTPSPAISSFVFYEGDAFPEWQGNALIGTLKATELYRMVLDGDRVVHRETLLSGLARIRDVDVGPDGAVYLLLEHASGGRIVRMVPD